MKKLFTIVAGITVLNVSAFAQGTILLQNLWTGGSAPIKDFSGANIPAGASQFTIQLWGGTSAGSLNAFVPDVTTTTWVGSGIFGLGGSQKVLTGLAGGTSPFFAVRIWDSTGGLTYDQAIAAGKQYGDSRLAVGAGGAGGAFHLGAALGDPNASPPVPAPGLVGMQGFSLTQVPEPSTIALGVLGVAAFLLRRRK